MKKYSRVSYKVRCQIDILLQEGFNRSQIAEKLGFHKSTISRELQRNFYFTDYTPYKANELAKERYKSCRRQYKLKDELLDFVLEALEMGWSPLQIEGRLKQEKSISVSHECIYQMIERNPELKILLRRKGRSYKTGRVIQRRSLRENRLTIHDRPEIANDRRRTGDWERDCLYVANNKLLLVCVDRKTRYIKIDKLEKRTSAETAKKTIELLSSTGKRVYTITNDNGSEFRGTPLAIRTYYCDPLKPNQRGTSERLIRDIRQWVTRKTPVDKLTKEVIQNIEDKLNFRPRKCLNFKTPFEAFYNVKVALAL